MSSTPPLPAGFTLDELPPLPAGFTLDELPPLPAEFTLDSENPLDSMPSLEPDVIAKPPQDGFANPSGNPLASIADSVLNFGIDAAKDVYSVGQVGVTLATGAVSGISVAAFGAAALLFGQDPQKVRDNVAFFTEKGTIMPWTERGLELLETLAPPLMALEEGVTDLSWFLALENPAAATLLKTQLLGGLELVLPFKSSKEALVNMAKLRRHRKKMEKLADDLGIDMSQSGLSESIIELANRMTPAQRAEHMPYLREQLQLASEKSLAIKTKFYEDAFATRTYVNSRSINQLAVGIRNELNKRFDLDEMPRVQKVFDKLAKLTEAPMEGLSAPSKINLRKFEDVRVKINAQIKDAKGTSEATALIKMKKEMDNFLENELNELRVEAGKSAISGDKAGVQAYRDARTATKEWHDNFNTDQAIVNFINKEKSAETMLSWIIGGTSNGVRASREAGMVVARMKKVLGDDHPAIQGIRTDFLYEVVSPLLHPDGPNFNQFVKNYELMIEANPTLVKQLNLDAGDFKELHDLSRLQKTLPPTSAEKKELLRRATTIIARLTVGHGIAKAGVKVGLFRDILNVIAGTDRVSQKAMFYELAGLKYGEIMLPRAHPLAAEFIAGAAITTIANTQEQ